MLDSAEKIWAQYFNAILAKVSTRETEMCTPFADPRQQEMALVLSHSFTACAIFFDGGFPGAKRARILVFPRNRASRKKDLTRPVLISGDLPPGILGQRDFWGAIQGLGIGPEMVGDIICRETEALVFLVPETAVFISQNLRQVGRFPVSVSLLEEAPPEFVPSGGRVKEIRGTVASLRLDAVAGLGFGFSRSRTAPLIRGGQVRLNHRVITQPSRPVKVGDEISLGTKGPVEIVENLGETRKGRISLLLRRRL